MPNGSFRKDERIRRKKDFERVFVTGKRGKSRYFSWVIAPHEEGKTRLGIVAGRKVGRAVKRNRIKRLLREFFRLNRHRFPVGHDIVIIVKPGIPVCTFADVGNELSGLLTDDTHG